jgi:hypothetical protein
MNTDLEQMDRLELLMEATKMRELLQAIHDAKDQDELHEVESKVDEYIYSLPK